MSAHSYPSRHGTGAACTHGLLALLLLLTALPALPETPTPPAELQVRYEAGMLTLDARDATLGEVLQRVGEVAHLRVSVPAQIAEQRGNWSLRQRPLPDALASIVQPHNMLLLHEPSAVPGGGLRVTEVHVLPSGTTPAKAAAPPAALAAAPPSAAAPLGLTDADKAPPTLDETVKWLQMLTRDPDATNRRMAVSELEALGSEAALRGLERGMNDKDAEVRLEVVQALGRIGAESSLPILGRAAISDRDERVREAAVDALESDPRPQAQNYLAQQRRRPQPGGAPAASAGSTAPQAVKAEPRMPVTMPGVRPSTANNPALSPTQKK